MLIVDVQGWLASLGLGQYASAFAAQQIDGDVIAELTDADLQALGLPLGPRKKILKAVAALHAPPAAPRAPRPGVERRNLTVLVCDLIGSTALATHCDPEELRAVLHGYMDACSAVVAEYGGHVARYHGDGLMAYFGYPQAREDAAERAVHAGLRIVEAVREVGGMPAVRLQTRVGIATGLAVVGDLIGEGAAREEAVVGETPALATRLQGIAAAEGVVVGQATRDLLGSAFTLEPLGPLALKGFDRPQPAWKVLGAERSESRFAAVRGGGARELVGRDSELAVLLARWHLAVAGEGQVVLLAGEAGLGKSRLVQALRGRLAPEAHRSVLLQCASYGQTSALRPVIEWIERAAGFAAEDDAMARRAKLGNLPGLSGDAEETVAQLLSLAGAETAPATPAERRERILAALTALLFGPPDAPPCLLILEDAQWSDAFTLDLLARLRDRVGVQRAMLLVSTRPGAMPDWAGRPDVTCLRLERLEPADAARLIDLLGGGTMAPDVRARIAERSDGVPLFVEELIRSVAETGGDAPPVPATLQDALMARLDRLGAAKYVAQCAAMLGREFHFRLLAACTGLPRPRLTAALHALVASGLATVQGAPPDAIYTFKHALIQDAAYHSMLRSERARLHGQIARMLPARFPRIAEEQPELVAHHHAEAGAAEAAIEWWERAGTLAGARAASHEGMRHIQAALRLLDALPQGPDRTRREIALRTALRALIVQLDGHASAESEDNLHRLAALLEDSPTIEVVGMLYSDAVMRLHRSEFAKADDAADRCVRLARRCGVPNAPVLGMRVLGYSALVRGDVVTADRWFTQSLAEYDPSVNRAIWLGRSHDPLASMMAQDVLVLIQTGRLDTAQRRAQAARVEAQAQQSPTTMGYVLVQLGLGCLMTGDPARIAPILAGLHDVTLRVEWMRWHEKAMSGWFGARIGDPDAGLSAMREGREMARDIHDRMWWPLYAVAELDILVRHARHAEALATSGAYLAMVAELGQALALPELHRLRGMALAATGATTAEIEAAFRAALEVARRHGQRLYALRAATALARYLVTCGRIAEARDTLGPAFAGFTEGLTSPDLREAQTVLAELASADSAAASG